MDASLVFLHGFLGTPATWDATRAHLGAHRGEAPWLPWHGPDPWTPRARASFESVVDELVERVVGERVSGVGDGAPPWLVGYSLGGRLAMGMLARHPQRFAGALLVGAHAGLRTEPERAARSAEDDARAEVLQRDGLLAFVDGWERLPLFATQAALPAEVRARQRASRLAHHPEALAQALRVLGLGRMPAWWRALAEVRDRVCIVVGERDEKFAALSASLAAEIGLEVETVAQAGHNVALEAPQALAQAVRARLGR